MLKDARNQEVDKTSDSSVSSDSSKYLLIQRPAPDYQEQPGCSPRNQHENHSRHQRGWFKNLLDAHTRFSSCSLEDPGKRIQENIGNPVHKPHEPALRVGTEEFEEKSDEQKRFDHSQDEENQTVRTVGAHA